jgi:hypothetical protein
MDFTKIDFSKFDAAALFDAEKVIAEIEKNTNTAIGYITDTKAKTVVQGMADASLELARAQSMAVKAYGEAVKKALQI